MVWSECFSYGVHPATGLAHVGLDLNGTHFSDLVSFMQDVVTDVLPSNGDKSTFCVKIPETRHYKQ